MAAINCFQKVHFWKSSRFGFYIINVDYVVIIYGFHSDFIKLLSQNNEVLRILIYIRLKINKK